MAETKGFYLRNTSVSELPDGATIDIVGYRPDNTVFDTFTVQVIAGIADIERTAQQVLGWPDEIRVEIVATTTQGLESRASTPALVRRGTNDPQFMVVSASFVIVNQTTLAATVELTENAPMTLQVRALGETVWENRVVQSSYEYGNADSPHYQETVLADGTWEVRAIDGENGAYETLIYTVSVDAGDVNETLVVSKSAVLIDRNTVEVTVDLTQAEPMAIEYRAPGAATWTLGDAAQPNDYIQHIQQQVLPDGEWEVRARDHVTDTWTTTFQNITVTPSNETTYGPQETFIYKLSVSSDDAEEHVATGDVSVGNSDLELVEDVGLVPPEQIVGLRFPGVTIPNAAQIDEADIQFGADEKSSGSTILDFRAQASDTAASFTTANSNISSRPTTAASVTWDVPAWVTLNDRLPAQQTPDLSPMIQEVVNRGGWASGNALGIIISGTGRRVAEPATPDANVPENSPEITIKYRPILTGGGGGGGTGGGSGATAGGGWDFDSYASAPEGRQWNIVHASAQGQVSSSHSRITRDQVIDGRTCYRHQVSQGELVYAVDTDGIPINVNLSAVDRVLLRFHHRRSAYSGNPGKDITLMLGYGYQGDMVQSGGNYNRPISEAEAFGSTEGACANSMHPAKNSGAENGIRPFVTHAVKVPNFDKSPGADNSQYQQAYYGDNLGGSGPTPALNQWHVVDIIAHRTEGYTMYMDGAFIADSSDGGPSNRAPFDDWNAQKCIWWWHRHMHGGNVTSHPSNRNYSEWFGGFYLATN